VLVEIQLAKVGTFFETQCTAMLVISPTAFSFVTYLKTHGWMGGWVGGWWMDGCIDPDISWMKDAGVLEASVSQLCFLTKLDYLVSVVGCAACSTWINVGSQKDSEAAVTGTCNPSSLPVSSSSVTLSNDAAAFSHVLTPSLRYVGQSVLCSTKNCKERRGNHQSELSGRQEYLSWI